MSVQTTVSTYWILPAPSLSSLLCSLAAGLLPEVAASPPAACSLFVDHTVLGAPVSGPKLRVCQATVTTTTGGPRFLGAHSRQEQRRT